MSIENTACCSGVLYFFLKKSHVSGIDPGGRDKHRSPNSIERDATHAGKMVPEVGLEPTWALSPPDFESGAYTNFATPAWNFE